MNNNEQFVTKLIELTKENKIRWSYLDSQPSLYNQLGLEPDSRSVPIHFTAPFSIDSSFCAEINSNYVVLYKLETNSINLLENLRLKTVPNTFKDIQTISLNENKELMLRLLNTIKSQFPNSKNIIDDILRM